MDGFENSLAEPEGPTSFTKLNTFRLDRLGRLESTRVRDIGSCERIISVKSRGNHTVNLAAGPSTLPEFAIEPPLAPLGQASLRLIQYFILIGTW